MNWKGGCPEVLEAISCHRQDKALIREQSQETDGSYHLSPWMQLSPR